MRDFVKELVRKDEDKKLVAMGFATFEALEVGAFKMSIQGSRAHYSEPRAVVPADCYSAFEVAIFEDDLWVSPQTDPRFSGNPWADLFELGASPVAGWVPVAVVAQMLADLAAAPACADSTPKPGDLR